MNKRKLLRAIDEVIDSLTKSARLYVKSINKKRYLEAESHADILVAESARLHRAARLLMGDNHPLDTDIDDDEPGEPEEVEVIANEDDSDDPEDDNSDDPDEEEEERPLI